MTGNRLAVGDLLRVHTPSGHTADHPVETVFGLYAWAGPYRLHMADDRVLTPEGDPPRWCLPDGITLTLLPPPAAAPPA